MSLCPSVLLPSSVLQSVRLSASHIIDPARTRVLCACRHLNDSSFYNCAEADLCDSSSAVTPCLSQDCSGLMDHLTVSAAISRDLRGFSEPVHTSVRGHAITFRRNTHIYLNSHKHTLKSQWCPVRGSATHTSLHIQWTYRPMKL